MSTSPGAVALWERLLTGPLRDLEPLEQEIFRARFELFWDDVVRPLKILYGQHDDYDFWRDRLFEVVARGYAARPSELRMLDVRRQTRPDWYQESTMLGYVCYADRFADNLNGVREHIDYLRELGVTYLHLMPLLKPREGANDGGYAVADYRSVNPDLGTMDDLESLAAELRQDGISLCIDLVCNHTAKDHEWARKARAGDAYYQDYYLMYDDRTVPDAFERTLPEVFPEFKQGNFTYYDDLGKWVWTTFNEYQWDLNYKNPAVMAEMLDIILFLANKGVEVLRLDAVAFMWKRLGTDSQNQPEAHAILQAFRALSRIAAPGLILKAEAIVAPDKLVPYLGRGAATNKECELAYHNVFMVLLWSALAERKVVLATKALQNMPAIASATSWCTYVRCHDDIGWAISDDDAAQVGLSGYDHRAFLSDFYSGRFPGTFARGGTFQFNEKTGDRRINGSLASLAGLELALEQGSPYDVELALRRITLLQNLILVFGGVPLLYMGDEICLLNDHSYKQNPDLADDTRWMHRPYMDWDKVAERHDRWMPHGRVFQALSHMIHVRKQTPALHAQAATHAVWTHNEHVLGILRDSAHGRVLVLANFKESTEYVPGERLWELGFAPAATDYLTETTLDTSRGISLEPYQVYWLH